MNYQLAINRALPFDMDVTDYGMQAMLRDVPPELNNRSKTVEKWLKENWRRYFPTIAHAWDAGLTGRRKKNPRRSSV